MLFGTKYLNPANLQPRVGVKGKLQEQIQRAHQLATSTNHEIKQVLNQIYITAE